ncbi:DUF6950 family protein [Brevundimonas sp. M1A4_2e]
MSDIDHARRVKNLQRRMKAAQATRKRFQGLAYEPGKRDCPKMALHVLHGLRIKVQFAKGLKWRNEAEGLRALKALGFANLIEAIDSLGFARIAPARALAGDLVALETDHEVGCISVAMGNSNYLAFTDHSPNAEVLTGLTGFARDDLGYCAWRTLDG